MALKRGYKQLMAEASRRIEAVSVEKARGMLDDPDVLFVDIRESGELEREGTIPGAFHAPRGMLEFWVDPESPYFKKPLGEGKQLVLFCASAWRSTLATAALVDMGVQRVKHLEGGFSAWKKADGPVVGLATKSRAASTTN